LKKMKIFKTIEFFIHSSLSITHQIYSNIHSKIESLFQSCVFHKVYLNEKEKYFFDFTL